MFCVMVRTFTHLFSHHASNNHKPKLLHVEGLVVLIVLTIATSMGIRTLSSGVGPLPAVLGFSSSISASDVVAQTNEQRKSAGLEALSVNGQLVAAALAKGNDMCAKQYWAHISPAGTTPWVFMKNSGYKYAVAGENLARDFSDTPSMMSAWMASPTHKANIVNGKYKEIGIAVVNCSLLGSDTALVVQMFGSQLVGNTTGKTGSGTTVRTAQVKAITTEDALPTIEPTEQVQGQESVPEVVGEAQPVLQLETPKPTSRAVPVFTPMQAQKAFLLAILILVCGVLCVDMWMVEQRKIIRISSRSLGHFLFLSGIVIVVLLVRAGAVL